MPTPRHTDGFTTASSFGPHFHWVRRSNGHRHVPQRRREKVCHARLFARARPPLTPMYVHLTISRCAAAIITRKVVPVNSADWRAFAITADLQGIFSQRHATGQNFRKRSVPRPRRPFVDLDLSHRAKDCHAARLHDAFGWMLHLRLEPDLVEKNHTRQCFSSILARSMPENTALSDRPPMYTTHTHTPPAAPVHEKAVRTGGYANHHGSSRSVKKKRASSRSTPTGPPASPISD